MKMFTVFFFVLADFFSALEQNNLTVSGQLKDRGTGKPLAFSSHVLFKNLDSTLVNGLVSSETGKLIFRLPVLKENQPLLQNISTLRQIIILNLGKLKGM